MSGGHFPFENDGQGNEAGRPIGNGQFLTMDGFVEGFERHFTKWSTNNESDGNRGNKDKG